MSKRKQHHPAFKTRSSCTGRADGVVGHGKLDVSNSMKKTFVNMMIYSIQNGHSAGLGLIKSGSKPGCPRTGQPLRQNAGENSFTKLSLLRRCCSHKVVLDSQGYSRKAL